MLKVNMSRVFSFATAELLAFNEFRYLLAADLPTRGVEGVFGASALYACCDLHVLHNTRFGLSPTIASIVCASTILHLPHQESMLLPSFFSVSSIFNW